MVCHGGSRCRLTWQQFSQYRPASIPVTVQCVRGCDQLNDICELNHFMKMYNYFLQARVSLRAHL